MHGVLGLIKKKTDAVFIDDLGVSVLPVEAMEAASSICVKIIKHQNVFGPQQSTVYGPQSHTQKI